MINRFSEQTVKNHNLETCDYVAGNRMQPIDRDLCKMRWMFLAAAAIGRHALEITCSKSDTYERYWQPSVNSCD